MGILIIKIMPDWKNWNPPQLSVTKADYQWTEPYAYDVHEIQKNRWTDRALAGSDLPQFFADINDYYKSTLDVAFTATAEYLNQRFLDEVPQKTGNLKASQSMTLK